MQLCAFVFVSWFCPAQYMLLAVVLTSSPYRWCLFSHCPVFFTVLSISWTCYMFFYCLHWLQWTEYHSLMYYLWNAASNITFGRRYVRGVNYRGHISSIFGALGTNQYAIRSHRFHPKSACTILIQMKLTKFISNWRAFKRSPAGFLWRERNGK